MYESLSIIQLIEALKTKGNQNHHFICYLHKDQQL